MFYWSIEPLLRPVGEESVIFLTSETGLDPAAFNSQTGGYVIFMSFLIQHIPNRLRHHPFQERLYDKCPYSQASSLLF